jgi:acid stress chaperone HdeB
MEIVTRVVDAEGRRRALLHLADSEILLDHSPIRSAYPFLTAFVWISNLSTRAQVLVDMSLVTCKQYLDYGAERRDMVASRMIGYFQPAINQPVVSYDKFQYNKSVVADYRLSDHQSNGDCGRFTGNQEADHRPEFDRRVSSSHAYLSLATTKHQ